MIWRPVVDAGVGLTYADAERCDMYVFLEANEAMDVANDRGDYQKRPPLTEEHAARIARGEPSIVKVPRMMVDFLKGMHPGGN